VFEKMYEIRFAGDEELMELMRWMKAHLSHRFPKGAGYLEVFKYALQYVREREDLARRAERRKKTARKTSTKSDSRHIPAPVKERVWTRDKGRCAFVGDNGRRCSSTRNLQFDHHPVPFARGGPSTADNLRLLCARHNLYAAGQTYGRRHMEKYYKRE
jgi:5-methylcytosine-specific restriction endonuclease McrA